MDSTSAKSTLEQIESAIAAHIQWKQRILQLVQAGGRDINPDAASRDDACELGRWLNSYKPTFREAAIYDVVRTRHAAFHRSAGRIVALAYSNPGLQSTAVLGKSSDFGRLSDELARELRNWRALLT